MEPALRRRLTRHVTRLATRNGISLTWIKLWQEAESFPCLGEAVVPRVKTGGDYLVCLHELGHILAPEARTRSEDTDTYGLILCEGSAWAWASANVHPAAVPHLEASDWAVIGESFSSHVAHKLAS